jgi:hypothetical protein
MTNIIPLGNEVQIQFEGQPITGWWRIEDDSMVAVWTPRARRATQIGGSPPEALARLMLHELAKEGKA